MDQDAEVSDDVAVSGDEHEEDEGDANISGLLDDAVARAHAHTQGAHWREIAIYVRAARVFQPPT